MWWTNSAVFLFWSLSWPVFINILSLVMWLWGREREAHQEPDLGDFPGDSCAGDLFGTGCLLPWVSWLCLSQDCRAFWGTSNLARPWEGSRKNVQRWGGRPLRAWKHSLELTEGEWGPCGAVKFGESSVKCHLSKNFRVEFFWIIFSLWWLRVYLLNCQILCLTIWSQNFLKSFGIPSIPGNPSLTLCSNWIALKGSTEHTEISRRDCF